MTGPTRTAPRVTRQQLVEQLNRELLNQSTMAPGSKLPSERQLAERFGISRPVVREVLRQMQERGLVDIEPGRGAFVRAVGALDAARVADGLYRRGQATARHLVDARSVLESRAASLAAAEALDSDIAAMEKALTWFDKANGVLERAQADLAFHGLVARASHNPIIELMFGSITRFVFELMLRSLDDPSVVRKGVPHHRQIVAAIKNRDAATAERIMAQHIVLARTTYGEDLDEPLDTLARRRMGDLFDSGALDDLIASALRRVDESEGGLLLAPGPRRR
jgi:GntR family transcriptional repressor for pyruvate dehydrogenase complex